MMLRYKLMFRSQCFIFNLSFQNMCSVPAYAASAIVTSTSTPGSMLIEVICFTISDGLWRSITRLWTRIWNLSQVLDPSPQGVLRVVIRRVLVGMRTGPLTLRLLSLAPLIKSAQTFSKLFTFLDVSVMRMRWMTASSAAPPFPGAAASAFVAIFDQLIKSSLLTDLVLENQRTSGEPEVKI